MERTSIELITGFTKNRKAAISKVFSEADYYFV